MANSSTESGGIGSVGVLTIVFIVLKLTNYITWSWWWVLSPMWISFIIVILILLFCFVGWVGYQLFINRKAKK